jgi:hypothetical protein
MISKRDTRLTWQYKSLRNCIKHDQKGYPSSLLKVQILLIKIVNSIIQVYIPITYQIPSHTNKRPNFHTGMFSAFLTRTS